MAHICIIDDKALVRDSLGETLSREQHEVTTFEDPTEALDAVIAGDFDLVITDLKMPKLDGVALLKGLRDGGCEVPVILMTAFGSVSSAVEAMKLGAYDYIQKPFDAEIISAQVERALQHRRMAKDNEGFRASIQDFKARRELVGDSDAMIQLRIKISQVARSSATVLISGESGTGKELIAWAIHEASPRRDRPMLCVNCAALSANLLESELFGHERGAFTGAERMRKGRFELADGGTLLLDEISEMAPPLQAKLLRVLQENAFERVGSSATRRSDVRVIATTNRNLSQWASAGRFREDLFFRLNVLPVEVAPLRARSEDVAILVKHFMEGIARREGRATPSFAPEAMKLMREYNWPGNVRELENLCHRVAALATGDTVWPDLLQTWVQPGTRQQEFSGKLRHGRMLEDVERQLIEQTLAEYGGHREKTAKALGMGVRTLGMRLKQWREEAESQQRRMGHSLVGASAAVS